MDGLVRTGTKFPYTILNIFFTKQKKIILFFINIFICHVDKANQFLISFRKKYIDQLQARTPVLILILSEIQTLIHTFF